MKKSKDYTLHLIFSIIAFCVIGEYACHKSIENTETAPAAKHACKWELCPYKGITPNQWNQAVRDYTQCEEATDAYLIDILHLEYPMAEYEELDSMLFSPMKKVNSIQ